MTMNSVEIADPAFDVQPNFLRPFFSQKKHIVLVGGRSSGKSFFAAQKCLSRIYDETNTNILVVMKVGRSLREKAYAETIKVINAHNLYDHYHISMTQMKIICKKNNNYMLFIGLDDENKAKGISGITSAWIDEADALTSEDFKMINTTVRADINYKGYLQIILTLNGKNKRNWIYRDFVQKPKYKNADIYYSSPINNIYLHDDVLGSILESFSTENEKNIYWYGKWGEVTDRIVFSNWKIEEIETDPAKYSYCYAGIDWGKNTSVIDYVGQNSDPNTLYFFREIVTHDKVPSDFIKLLNSSDIPRNILMIADEADPNSISEMKRLGFRCRKTEKSRDPKMSAINWLQGKDIIIHPSCKLLIDEIQSYSYLRDDKNDVINDKEVQPYDDHAIDAIRYGTSMFRRRMFVTGGNIKNRLF